MIILKQLFKGDYNYRERLEKELSEDWGEKVIIIPFGSELVEIREDKKLEE